uniref:DUF668 domain-containing protein n=1 Tax=Opuntia streptacantha TaxID=393608 RepID=A0A7C8YVH5_OPUST
MVAEPWLLKMGNQVSNNFKSSPFLNQTRSKKKNPSSQNAKQTIGILSFEVANVMSKLVHLHKSVSHQEVSKLKNETIKSEGVKKLVSSDESFLLELAYAERLDELNGAAETVSRLGKKCTEPALQGFEHVYGDITSGTIEVRELGFLVKDMECMVRKMERYVGATSDLYRELQALNELVCPRKKCYLKKIEESQETFELKLSRQRQIVKLLKESSLWNQSCDKVAELLARTICTVYASICIAYGNNNTGLRWDHSGSILSGSHLLDKGVSATSPLKADSVKSIADCGLSSSNQSNSLTVQRKEKKAPYFRSQLSLQRVCTGLIQRQDFNLPCGPTRGRILTECLSFSNSVSRIDEDDNDDEFIFNDWSSHVSGSPSIANGMKREQAIDSGCLSRSEVGVHSNANQRQVHCLRNGSIFGPKSRLATHVTPSTVGGSALGLHYANVIIVIEKLLSYPQLVGKGARDDLYQMLPTSLRESLRTNLRSHSKNRTTYDAPVAHNWKETLDGVLKWLAPLAHNMIKWQSERNFQKQQQIVTGTNVLLLQTLYFADRVKTEAAICELLVGLSNICRCAQQQRTLLNSTSNFGVRKWRGWQLQHEASCLDR